jgi:glycosyltransferase involved in cell wall biosynthesis
MAIFSILLPTRNRVDFLRESLSSIQRQTCADIEILVMDDGSQDGTEVFLAAAARCDDRVRVFRNERSGGLPAALNILLSEATGEWIARMDDDDLALPQRLEKQLEYATTNKLDVCGAWYRRFGWLPGGAGRPATDHEAIVAGLLFQPPLLHPSVLMQRSVLADAGGYCTEYPHAEDYELWTRLATAGARFGNVPHVLLRYRMSRNQVSRAFNPQQVTSAQRIRARYLADCGIPASQEEVDLHVRVRDPAPIESLDELRAFEAWLVRLREHFAGNPAAAQVVAQQWLFIGCRGAGLGMRCWRMWRASPLAAAISARKAALLFALCAGRVRYRSAPYRLLEPFAPA